MTPSNERRLEQAAGLFVIATLAGLLLLAAFGLSGGDWFMDKRHATVLLDDATGLAPGTDVTISGIRVGSVQSVRLTEARAVEVRLYVDARQAHHLRADSVARATMTMTGKVLVIQGGSQEAGPLPEGGALVPGPGFDPMQALEAMQLLEGLQRLQSILDDVAALSRQLSLGEGRGPELAARLSGLIQDLDAGRGPLGRLIEDEQMAAEIGALVVDLRAMAVDLQRGAGALDQASASISRDEQTFDAMRQDMARVATSMDASSANVARVADDFGASVARINASLEAFEATLEAIQRLPLVRAQVDRAARAQPDPDERPGPR